MSVLKSGAIASPIAITKVSAGLNYDFSLLLLFYCCCCHSPSNRTISLACIWIYQCLIIIWIIENAVERTYSIWLEIFFLLALETSSLTLSAQPTKQQHLNSFKKNFFLFLIRSAHKCNLHWHLASVSAVNRMSLCKLLSFNCLLPSQQLKARERIKII